MEVNMSNQLGDVHPYRATNWIEQHFEMNTADGLLPEDQEIEIWRLYILMMASCLTHRSASLWHVISR
jgi:hypothetical protein